MNSNPAKMRFSAVVQAAGLSSRMAGPHKMMLLVGAQPAIRRSEQAVLDSGVQEVVVVAGYQGRDVMNALIELPVTLRPNIRYEDGQMSSVAVGVAELAMATDAIMVCVGDMVLITPQDYRDLMAVYEEHSEFSIVTPRYQGERGNRSFSPLLVRPMWRPGAS